MKQLWIGMIFSLLLPALPASGQDAQSGPGGLPSLIGRWKGSGESMGKTSTVTMTWEEVLGSKYHRIQYRFTIPGEGAGEQAFEGHGYYRKVDNASYEGTWFDSQGALHPLKGETRMDSFVAHWGTKGTVEGKTVYLVKNRQTVMVVDSILARNGQWRQFAKSILERVQ